MADTSLIPDLSALVRQELQLMLRQQQLAQSSAIPVVPAVIEEAHKEVGLYKAKDPQTGRPAGKWRFRMTHNGVEVNVSTEYSSLKKANAFAIKTREAIEGGTYKREKRGVLTLKAWWPKYKAAKHPLKAMPRHDNKALPFIEKYGHMRLNEFRKDLCQVWVNERLTTIATGRWGTGTKVFSPNSIRTEVAIITAIFNEAIEAEYLVGKNPWRKVVVPDEVPRQRILKADATDPDAPSEQDRLLRWLDPRDRFHAITIIGGGFRTGETTRLVPAKVDREALLATVTGKGNKTRTVPIHPVALLAIDRQRQARGLAWDSTEALWPEWKGALAEQFRQAVAALKLERITPHDLRRTFSTRLKLSKTATGIISELLGHSDEKVTKRHYIVTKDETAHLTEAIGLADLKIEVGDVMKGVKATEKSQKG